MLKFNSYEVISHLNTWFKKTLLDIDTEHDLDSNSMELKYTLELVQMIFTRTHMGDFKENNITEKDIYKIIEICYNKQQ